MPAKHHITTFTGRAFNLCDPTPDMVCIEDIAHHLAMVCRWAGATTDFFSVAQHSVLVSKIVPPVLQRWALLHDAAEAYVGDVTRPLKVLMRQIESSVVDRCAFDQIESRIMKCVAQKFDLGWPEPTDLKYYDDQLQNLEARMFVRHDGNLHSRTTGEVTVLPDLTAEQRIPTPYLVPLSPGAAELMFLARYRKIFLDEDGL